MKEPDKIAFAGDWHMNAHWAYAAIEHCAQNNVTHIVHAGDFGFTFSSNFVKTVEQACEEFDIDLLFVDGNHDNHPWLYERPESRIYPGMKVAAQRVYYIPRGHRWNWWGLTFMGLGGATSVDRQWRTPMVDWWPTERITFSEAYMAGSGGPVDVMICHDAPTGVPIPGITLQNGLANGFPHAELIEADRHRELMRGIVDKVQPKVFIHGHYHRRYTWVDETTVYEGLDMDDTEGNLLMFNEFEFEIHRQALYR